MPGLRRLRDPRRGAELHAGARHRAREDRLHLRHRLRRAVPVLHADVRDALDPRPRAGDRDGSRGVAPGSLGVGRVGRRRRAVDRRQPSDPRAAPQREPEDPDVQQPDLRADEGPVLADERAGKGHGLDADRQRGLSVQPAGARARRRRDVRRARPRRRQAGPDGRAAPRRRSTRAPRSSRSSRTATSTTTASSPTSARTRKRGRTSSTARSSRRPGITHDESDFATRSRSRS